MPFLYIPPAQKGLRFLSFLNRKQNKTSFDIFMKSTVTSVLNLIVWLLIPLPLTSCIKDEPLNAEADILDFRLEKDILLREPIITNNSIRLYVNAWESDLTQLAPYFEITEGATIEPASGTPRDFTTPQTYTVTSQDGRYKKTYTVEFAYVNFASDYHFENVKFHTYQDSFNPTAPAKKLFHIFYDRLGDGKEFEWSSGNAGFMILNQNAPAENYPTSQAEDGYIGKCAKLVTRSTGILGANMGSPLAAGNLFWGNFSINMLDMPKSTRFGIPFDKTPIRLSGYYKYKAGERYTNKWNVEQEGKKDIFDIYAVMYEVTDEVPYLDGTNIKTHANIVMMAQVDNRKETDTWTPFMTEFKLLEGKQLNPKKLAEGKYNLALVLSSSEGGAYFNGAVGSTLYVDEINLYYE